METNMKAKALGYLEKNFEKCVDMIVCILHDDIDFIYCENDGVFIYDKSAFLYMIATDSEETCLKATAGARDIKLVACHNPYERDIIKRKYTFAGCNECFQVIWRKERPAMPGKFRIKRLEPTEENVEFVFKNYTLAFSREHLAFIMKNLGMYAAYTGENIAGFIGRHEERSIGLMEVLPEYRRMGVATELALFMINRVMDEGEIPYGQVIVDNEKSIAMQKKLGFTFSESHVYWLYS
ncbi:MAG: GNAT family N-acetyltransferase [Clostridia bacterium]|nr:GNAT family N-acetyltransferase [Clostridia bacterium]